MKIFPSYGHDLNSPLVERIADDLETHQYDVWIDRNRLKFERFVLKRLAEALEVYQKILTSRAVQDASAEAECQRLVASIKRHNAIETLTLSQLARRLSGKPYL